MVVLAQGKVYSIQPHAELVRWHAIWGRASVPSVIALCPGLQMGTLNPATITIAHLSREVSVCAQSPMQESDFFQSQVACKEMKSPDFLWAVICGFEKRIIKNATLELRSKTKSLCQPIALHPRAK